MAATAETILISELAWDSKGILIFNSISVKIRNRNNYGLALRNIKDSDGIKVFNSLVVGRDGSLLN